MTRLAHRHDPHSSHLAAYQHTVSGQRRTNAERVHEAVLDHPGCTARELVAVLPDLDKYEISRRLTDGRNDGRLEHGPMRKCAVSGRLSVTWYPAARQGVLL